MLSVLKKRGINRKERWSLIEIDGRSIDVRVTVMPRASRLTLSLVPASRRGEQLRLTVPRGTSDREIDDFLSRNRHWASIRLARLPKVIFLESGSIIPFRGKDYEIVHCGTGRGIVEAVEESGKFIIKVFGDSSFISRKVHNFLKREARRDLSRSVSRYCKALGVRAKSITIRDTITRWGSCSSEGSLNFSWRIILAPPEVLDYLVAHEVAHLREMNHSDRFWSLVEQLYPDYHIHKDWLRVHGTKLHSVVPVE